MSVSETMENPARNRWAALGAWLLLVAGMTAAFGHNFREMWHRWFPSWRRTHLDTYDRIVGGQSYYTHGPLIPGVSLIITILLIRHTRIAVRPARKLGGVVLGLSLLLHLVASLARVNFASGFAFIGVLAGMVLLFWGTAALRRLWFPIALFLFMVPLPEVSIAQWNFRLKMIAANAGVTLANAIGIVAEQSGNRVFLEDGKTLIIANVCNGLRTLISLLAFGALYTYVCRLRGLWRLGLFAMTVPVAAASNSLRMVSLILVADMWDVKTATGWYHDTSGVLIFILAFLLMFALEKLILWSRKAVGRPAKIVPLFDGQLRGPGDAGQWSRMVQAVGGTRGYVAGVLMVLVAAGALWMNRTVPSTLTEGLVKKAVPADLTIQGRPWHSCEMPLDEKTLAVLEFPGYINRRYDRTGGAPGEQPIYFCVIFSKDNRKGTHPPDLCLEGSGEGIVAKADIDVPVGGDRNVPCRELIVQTGSGRHYFLYTYKCGRRYTRSFWNQQLVIFSNGLLRRDASGSLIRVSTPMSEAIDLAEARSRSMEMLRTMLPHLDRNLP